MSSNSIEAVLTQLESQPDALKAHWCVPPQTGQLLRLLTQSMQARRVLEVGTSIGYSGLWFALAGAELTTLDASAERLAQARQHFQAAGVSPRTLHGDALTLLAGLEGELFDVMFIDARKSEYVQYFAFAQTLLRPGGLLIADNTVSHRAQMQDFIEAVSAHPHWVRAEISEHHGLLLALRTV
jgi:predicted O-methyltransferase YrrM